MTLAYAAERRFRSERRGPLDYDDSLVPGQIVASVMHLPHVTGRQDRDLGLLLRWSYGSAFGIWHGALPVVAYASLTVAGVVVRRSPRLALYLVGAAALLLLFVGIHNSWDSAIWMTTRRERTDGSSPDA